MPVAATVTRINRLSKVIEVLPVGVAYPVSIPYFDVVAPPPPLSQVMIDQTASGWAITQPISQRSIVFHDGFSYAQDTGAGPFLMDPYAADTDWVAGGGANDQAKQSSVLAFPGGSGIIRLFGSQDVTVRKNPGAYLPDKPGAFWLSGYISTLLDQVGDIKLFGLDDLNFRSVYFGINTNGLTHKWQLYTNDSLGPTLTDTPYQEFQLFGGLFQYVDIVISVGSFAALWIDGSGPYYSTTNIPSLTSAGLSTVLRVLPAGAPPTDIFFDYVRLESFTPAVHPDRIGFASADIPCSK